MKKSSCSLWKTIDSAPKDETEVLLYNPEEGIYVGFYCRAWIPKYVWRPVYPFPSSDYAPIPTHWQPLPYEPCRKNEIDCCGNSVVIRGNNNTINIILEDDDE